ncbi:MAG: hypothetical protein RLZZ76_772 [Candidatus Parcubacteria bacterium]|jgi:cytoskeletal protein RodZ
MKENKIISQEEPTVSEGHFGTTELLTEKPSYFGIILSILIVILMCILGGLYAWSEQILKNKALEENTPTRPTNEQNNEPESTTAEASVETLGAMSTSDEIDAIEADLESTPIEAEVFEAELNNVESTLTQ